MARKQISSEALMALQQRLSSLPARSHDRRILIQETAQLYGVSEDTLYRILRERARPKSLRRSDFGDPRILPQEELILFCEIIAAMKIRTSNKKGRHISTSEAIRLLEGFGIDTPKGFVKASKSVLKKTTVNRYLKEWGYDRHSLSKQPPAVRFQARYSNECWQFDLSPSDLKQVKDPLWIQEGKGHPLLMLYSVVDDRSGVAYQEYRCVYGEDVEGALRFLFNAMSPKTMESFPFQGIPQMIYMDNGPIYKSLVFRQVMRYLGIEVHAHLPKGQDGRRVTARSKGKVERPFRSVKDMHETLYHFHEPKDEEEANAWLMNFLLRYNHMDHRSEPHSRFEDWLENLPESGIRQMCTWDRFCTFAREPERRKVGIDARVTVDGVAFEVAPELAGETVILWWGLFDNELYVEYGEKRYGPYIPVGGPIPLHRYRKFKKTQLEKRADRIENLAQQLSLPKAALTEQPQFALDEEKKRIEMKPFSDPDPFQEFTFPNAVAAKKAIAQHLGLPLAKLPQEQMAKIDEILALTLRKSEVIQQVQDFFGSLNRGES